MRVLAVQECFVENMIRPERMVFDIPDYKTDALHPGTLEMAPAGAPLGIMEQTEPELSVREQLRNLGQGIPDQTPPPEHEAVEEAEPDDEVAAPPTRRAPPPRRKKAAAKKA